MYDFAIDSPYISAAQEGTASPGEPLINVDVKDSGFFGWHTTSA